MTFNKIVNLKKILTLLSVLILLIACGKDEPQGNVIPETPEQAEEVIEEQPEEETPTNKVPAIESQTFEVNEDISDDSIVGTVLASDEDSDTLTFNILENSDNLFEIENNGELSLKEGQELEYKLKKQHIINVEVSDGIDTASASITINLKQIYGEPFIFTIETNFIRFADLSSRDPSITNVEFDYKVDWGDGKIEENVTEVNKSHTYDVDGTYTVKIYGIYPYFYMNDPTLKVRLRTVEQWGDIEWKSFRSAFNSASRLTINAPDIPDLSNVTNTAFMFRSSIRFNSDLNGWNVSNVTNMRAMFANSWFEGDISNWDVSNVTNMSAMFAFCRAFDGDLSSWNVSNVLYMEYMFQDASIFEGSISNWKVDNVLDMSGMFDGASSFNDNISNWNVENVTNMERMFQEAVLFNYDLNNWNVSKVKDMNGMFNSAYSFNGNISNWNVSEVNDMWAMFANTETFNTDISGWNVANVTKMYDMFANARVFNSEINNRNVINVTDMRRMFQGASSFNRDLSNWNVDNVQFCSGFGLDVPAANSGFILPNFNSCNPN